MNRRHFAGACLAALAIIVPQSLATQTRVEAATVTARPIAEFRIGSDERRFGRLTFVGGLEMVSRTRSFGSLSAFRFREPGSALVAVADTGYWLFGRIARDPAGLPAGLEDVTIARMLDGAGREFASKADADAEGLSVRGDVATVSFERDHRLAEHVLDPAEMGAPRAAPAIVIPKRELRQNKGIETVVAAPAEGRLAGARVVIAERSLDPAGNVFGAVIEGPGRGVFTVVRHGEFDITDGAFLPDGDLLLLERSFSFPAGVAMRLRLIAGEDIRAGAVVDGEELLSADMGYQIDNMEGLDVWRRADGATMVSLLSDDNQSIIQRNLYLEFRLD